MRSTRVIAIGFAALLSVAAVAHGQERGTTHYVGIGLRAGLRDAPAAVVALSLQVVSRGNLGLSLRPTLLLGEYVEFRAALTLDLLTPGRVRGFAGAGAAFNESGSRRLDPLLSGGADLMLGSRFGFTATLNHLFKPADGDTELMATANFLFGTGPLPDGGG